MSTLAEIEAAIPNLTPVELVLLEKVIQAKLQKPALSKGHSVLDIPPVSVGSILPFSGDDLLGDMLEGRP